MVKLHIGKIGKEAFSINAQELVTGRTCVIGQSGSGKSYLVAVICEKLAENNIGFCIVDTEGEYFSLKEKFQVLWVGGDQADIDIEKANLKELAKRVVKDNVPLILDISDVIDERKVIEEFATHLYNIETKLRTPYLLIIEEADKFVPQSKDSMKKLEEISRRGRKRGLGILLATQRPALVNKNVLSQCGNQFIGKLTTENDLQAVNLFFASRKELEDLPKLEVGEFFLLGNLVSEKTKMKSIQRLTKHKGLTPKLIPKTIGKISKIKESMGEAEIKEEDVEIIEEEKRKLTAIKPKIDRETIIKLVQKKRKKKYVLFGDKERVTSIDLLFHPLIYIEIKQPKGFIKKDFKTNSFIIDGINAKLVKINGGLKYYGGFDGLLGLNEREARVLLSISKKPLTIAEIELKTKLHKQTIRKIVKDLENKKLMTYSGSVGRARVYSPLIKIDIPSLSQYTDFPAKDMEVHGRAIKTNIEEKSLRNIIKAINPKAEIMKFDVFYYPVYSVNLHKRKLKIDAISGREI